MTRPNSLVFTKMAIEQIGVQGPVTLIALPPVALMVPQAGIYIKRLSEGIANKLRSTTALITVAETKADDSEDIAEQIIVGLHDQSFSFLEVKDISFEKRDFDVSELDDSSLLFVRQMEFEVSW